MNHNVTYINIITSLRNQAIELGMSYRVISERSGVSIATVKRFLSGDSPNTDLVNVVNIAEAIGMKLDVREEISAQQMREKQVHHKTLEAVRASAATNALEGQGPNKKDEEVIYARVSAAIRREPDVRFWVQPIEPKDK